MAGTAGTKEQRNSLPVFCSLPMNLPAAEATERGKIPHKNQASQRGRNLFDEEILWPHLMSETSDPRSDGRSAASDTAGAGRTPGGTGIMEAADPLITGIDKVIQKSSSGVL